MTIPETHVLTALKVKLIESDAPAYQIAAKCGLHPSVLSKYAMGQESIKPKHLRALCKFFKCKQADLLGTVTFEYQREESHGPD